MQTPLSAPPSSRAGAEDPRLSRLAAAVEHAAHFLPAQGPITVFIHHNTLHALEELPFDRAVAEGARVFGSHPYLTEDLYREALRRGRIRSSTLREVLARDLGTRADDDIPRFGTRLDLRMASLQYPLRTGPTEELTWYVAEADALRRVRVEASSAVRSRLIAETRRWVMRDLRGRNELDRSGLSARPGVSSSLSELLDRFGETRIESWRDEEWEGFTLQALWRICCDGIRGLPHFGPAQRAPVRYRDLLFEATGVDSDAPVNDLLIRFCAAFLDQGVAHWRLPRRDEGFFRAFTALYRQPGGPPARWMRGLDREMARLEDHGINPLSSILESLDIIGVAEQEWDGFLSATFLAMRGWAGMIREVELRGDRTVQAVRPGSLVEFLAIRLILDRFSLAHTAREELGFDGPLDALQDSARLRSMQRRPPSVEQRAFAVFQLAQVLGISPDVLYHLEKEDWATILEELESFTELERRRVFHLAYEERFCKQTLDAVALHAPKAGGRPASPKFQVTCCLDEREESFRRHIEEIAPGAETFGAAGFFNVPMYYRGAADAHFTPLCPVVIRPRHWVTEEVEEDLAVSSRRRARTRRALGTASHQFHVGTRTFALGALLTGAVGVLAGFPLVARILFPRLTSRVRRVFGRIVQTPPHTRLRLERSEATPGPEGRRVGYDLEEMTAAGERLLRDMGLTAGFARLVIFLGHGSNSLNNPHNSAYNCGACGGASGGPNARAVAQILNDPRVREGLATRGLAIPPETVVVGGHHDTCDDSVVYHDVDRIPRSHREEFDAARDAIERACDRNAHERCRRFMSAPLTLTFEKAREHVEGRAEDLSQTRPELGHATNAITIVGRRAWSRGLFLDRRAFLASYDPTQDDAEATILTRILGAVYLVCSGINLEYYFSRVDNATYGAGTKLPHNLSGLLGVMDGAASDLRTGLPWQMVELHEPVRSLFLIETTAEVMTRIIDENEMIGRLTRNGWVLLSLIHPRTRALSVYRDGAFEPYEPQAAAIPKAASSVDWYRGWRDHLEFAEIGE